MVVAVHGPWWPPVPSEEGDRRGGVWPQQRSVGVAAEWDGRGGGALPCRDS
jgi:hypothetical protein